MHYVIGHWKYCSEDPACGKICRIGVLKFLYLPGSVYHWSFMYNYIAKYIPRYFQQSVLCLLKADSKICTFKPPKFVSIACMSWAMYKKLIKHITIYNVQI